MGRKPQWSQTGSRREGFQGVPKPLDGPPPSGGTTTVGRAFWNVPHPRNPFLTGRGKVVVDLRKQLTKRPRAAHAQVISGLGGIGKTQTAVEYAYRYRDKYKAVLWLNAGSTLGLKTGYTELARLLHLPHPENDLDEAVIAFKQWLKAEAGWLLILDNADDPALLTPFLPEAEHGHILVTSRAQDFQNLGIIKSVELEELPVEDATAFLLKRCGREDAHAEERDAATQLARTLDGLPLALEQAAAYIVERRTTFRSYLESYQSRGLELVEARLPALGRYVNSVATTWAANFEAVEEESQAAAHVLQLSAFLAPDAIPFELLTRGVPELITAPQKRGNRFQHSIVRASSLILRGKRRILRLFPYLRGVVHGPPVRDALARTDGDPLLVNDTLQPLGRFSLIHTDGHDETYSIHRMVQQVLKDAMDDAPRRLWAERAVRAVNQAFPNIEYANWPLCDRLLPHAIAVACWIERNRMVFPAAGRLSNQTASYLRDRAQYAEAGPLFKQATEIYRTALGERHPDYATSLNNLAELYCAMGRHAEAEPLFKQAMEVLGTALGEEHPSYAASLNNMAELSRAMGRHAEAEPLFKQAMEICRTALGERHADYAGSLNNLAGLYHAMGRHAEAEPLCKQAMEICRTALGERHPDYATSLNSLAVLYSAMGRHAEAEPLFKQAMTICRTALGERHPNYATSLNDLALLYNAMGRHAEAEPLCKQAMEICRTALGERHPAYAVSLSNLAELYRAMGRHAEAEPLFKQAMEIRRTALGERHPDYAN